MSENEIKRIQQVDDAKLTLDKHIETNEYYPQYHYRKYLSRHHFVWQKPAWIATSCNDEK